MLPLALAQYIGYLGPPPLEMIKRSPLFSEYFDDQGKLLLSFLAFIFASSLSSLISVPSYQFQHLTLPGNWTYDFPIPQTSFEDFVTVIPPGEEKDLFLKYIRKQLTWDPEVRAQSFDLLRDEWLMRPTDIMGPAFPSAEEPEPVL